MAIESATWACPWSRPSRSGWPECGVLCVARPDRGRCNRSAYAIRA